VIVDTTALLAIIFREPGCEALIDKIVDAPAVAVGSPTLAETGIVLTARLGETARGMLERLLDEFDIEEIPFGEVHWREAVEAYRRFGLDLGDALTYATARLAGERLLYADSALTRTDVG
jgi:ribonuclease VapC